MLGGKIERLADIRLQFLPLLFAGVILRFATEAAIVYGVDLVDELRLPLFGLAYGLLLFTLWQNRGYPGMALAFVGVASNALVIMVNGGYMPVWLPAYAGGRAGRPARDRAPCPAAPDARRRVPPPPRAARRPDPAPDPTPPQRRVDRRPVPDRGPVVLPVLHRPDGAQGVARGDRPGQGGAIDRRGGGDAVRWRANRRPRRPGRRRARRRRPPPPIAVEPTWSLFPPGETVSEAALQAGTGLSPGLEEASVLQRPLMLGGRGVGMASPATSTSSQAMALDAAGVGPIDVGVPVARPSRLEDIRRHPYIRLALNGSFSALWVGQVISLFGDRVNQLALIAFVFEITDSPTAVALTFLVSTIPNLIFSPVAGTLVDRWDQKQVLVVSDLLRAALVLLVPGRRADQRLARVPAGVPDHDGVDLLPARPGSRSCRGSSTRATCCRRTPRCGSARPSRTSSTTRSPACSCVFLGARRCPSRSGSTP